jgi:hypothetical protein
MEVAGVSGACDEIQTIILIDPSASLAVKQDTILHEPLHAIWGQTMLDKKYTDDEEEAVIWSLTPRIVALLRDNPDLVAYILQ